MEVRCTAADDGCSMLRLRQDNGAEEAWEEEAWEEDDCEEVQEEQAQNEEAAKAEARVGKGVGSSSADTAEEGPDKAEAWQTWTEANRDVHGEQEHQEQGQGWEETQNEWMEDEEEDRVSSVHPLPAATACCQLLVAHVLDSEGGVG